MSAIHPQTLRRLAYFATIAELGSVRAAASQLRLSTSVVSQALADLEQDLGVSLATRSTRNFELTDAGRATKDAADQMLVAADKAMALGRDERALTGQLGITLPDELASHILPPVLRRFRQAHPQVQITLQAEDEVIDLAQSPYDIAIRGVFRTAGTDLDDAHVPISLVAAADFAVTHSEGGCHVQAPLLAMPGRNRTWQGVQRTTGQVRLLSCDGVLTVSSRETARHLALQGLGVAPLLAPAVTQDIAAGRLVEVAPGVDFGAVVFDLVYRDSLPAPQARVFADMFNSHIAAGAPV